jgi:exodeoxyribonuclease VII large subunit
MYFHPPCLFPSTYLFRCPSGAERGEYATAAGYNCITMTGMEEERIYSIGEINRLADGLLQGLVVWVEGEVSNLRPYPNYTFFSLSDEDASLSCIAFRQAMQEMECELREGMTVLARGRLGIYVRRGQYRLNVYEAQESGEGRLRREFLMLMRRLSKEGLFEEEIKKPLPPYPDAVGLITSLEGAAVRDVVTNLTRRFPGARLVVRGVRVQGDDAVGDITAALELFNRGFAVDVLIMARGGGSLEDLHPFNTEEVVRAIRASSIPVVTGVGHEPDMTLADLAADFRASTPTGAAEAVVPSCPQVLSLLREREVSLGAGLRRRVHDMERSLGSLERRRPFSDPAMLVSQAAQRMADGEAAMLAAARLSVERRGRRVEAAAAQLARYPREYRELPGRLDAAARKLAAGASAWRRWREREPDMRARELKAAGLGLLARWDAGLKLAASRLEALSPLAVLGRGYAIATRAGETRPLTDSAGVERGDEVEVRLHRGRLQCEVTDVDKQEDGGAEKE